MLRGGDKSKDMEIRWSIVKCKNIVTYSTNIAFCKLVLIIPLLFRSSHRDPWDILDFIPNHNPLNQNGSVLVRPLTLK